MSRMRLPGRSVPPARRSQARRVRVRAGGAGGPAGACRPRLHLTVAVPADGVGWVLGLHLSVLRVKARYAAVWVSAAKAATTARLSRAALVGESSSGQIWCRPAAVSPIRPYRSSETLCVQGRTQVSHLTPVGRTAIG